MLEELERQLSDDVELREKLVIWQEHDIKHETHYIPLLHGSVECLILIGQSPHCYSLVKANNTGSSG